MDFSKNSVFLYGRRHGAKKQIMVYKDDLLLLDVRFLPCCPNTTATCVLAPLLQIDKTRMLPRSRGRSSARLAPLLQIDKTRMLPRSRGRSSARLAPLLQIDKTRMLPRSRGRSSARLAPLLQIDKTRMLPRSRGRSSVRNACVWGAQQRECGQNLINDRQDTPQIRIGGEPQRRTDGRAGPKRPQEKEKISNS
jgi:hypothetical protein